MKVKDNFRFIVAASLVFAFVSVLFAEGGHCLCNAHLNHSIIEANSCCQKEDQSNKAECCNYCEIVSVQQSDRLGAPQIWVSFSDYQSSFALATFLHSLSTKTCFACRSLAYYNGSPAISFPAIHISSTVLLI